MDTMPILFTALFGWSLASSAVQAVELTQWEKLSPNEEEEALSIVDEVSYQMKRDYISQGKRVFRDAHPRATGCVAAQFKVEPELDKRYQTGVFATPGKTYDAIMRFSAALGPDGENVNDARGLAIKLFGVPGVKISPHETEATNHDFIMINFPTFVAPTAHDFGGIIKIASNPKNLASFLKEAPISHALQLKNLVKSSKLNPLNGKSLLAHQFFSQVPYLFKSESIMLPVKFTVRPCAAHKIERKLDGTKNELRNDLQDYLQNDSVCYEFAYQFYKEGVGFEVEDPTKIWDENKSPFIKFATITVSKQTFATDEKLRYCDNLSFEPWRALDVHRPLGNINRARRIVYRKISEFRHAVNKETAVNTEPQDLSAWNAMTNATYNSWREVKIPNDSH